MISISISFGNEAPHDHDHHLLNRHAGHGAGEPVQLHHQLLPVEGHRGRPRDHPGGKKNILHYLTLIIINDNDANDSDNDPLIGLDEARETTYLIVKGNMNDWY